MMEPLKLTATQLSEMLTEASTFSLHLSRLNDLDAIAKETNDAEKRRLMLKVAKCACMWVPTDPTLEDLKRLYAMARTAVIAEGNARTVEFRRKWRIEITTLDVPEWDNLG